MEDCNEEEEADEVDRRRRRRRRGEHLEEVKEQRGLLTKQGLENAQERGEPKN